MTKGNCQACRKPLSIGRWYLRCVKCRKHYHTISIGCYLRRGGCVEVEDDDSMKHAFVLEDVMP